MLLKFFVHLAIVLLAIAISASPARCAEWVHLRSAPLPPSAFQIRLAQQHGESAPAPEPGIEIAAWLDKPAGAGPFPAVVFLHGCLGATEAGLRLIGERTVSWGYVYLGIDSFGPRGIRQQFQEGLGATIAERARDAYGALDYLARLPFVDPNRIALMGASQRAIVTLFAIERNDGPELSDRHFKAAIAEYPCCLRGGGSVALLVPTLVLVGELDDWTPARFCRDMVERLAPNSAPVKLVIYPGAYHAFNAVSLKGHPRTYDGHRMEYNEAAANAANWEMKQFLAECLGQ
jgi:dienelactone hydrolase